MSEEYLQPTFRNYQIGSVQVIGYPFKAAIKKSNLSPLLIDILAFYGTEFPAFFLIENESDETAICIYFDQEKMQCATSKEFPSVSHAADAFPYFKTAAAPYLKQRH